MADTEHTTSKRKSPAFQFYPSDFVTGTLAFSTEEIGAYMLLICHCWEHRSLPSDMQLLARIARLSPSRMKRVWPALSVKFTEMDGLYIQPRIERERQKQEEYRRRQSDKGRASGESRRRHPVEPETNRGSTAVASRFEPKPNSSSSSSSSDFSHKRARASDEEPFDSFDADPPVDSPGIRANAFIERYKALHVRLRKGAHYIGRPTFDFQEAMQLVAVYDDARLDKLAFVWLNTDHNFAQSGTRSIAKFRSMASWCEERVIEWEEQHGELKVAV